MRPPWSPSHKESAMGELQGIARFRFHEGKVEDFKGTYEEFQARQQKPVVATAKGRK